LAPDLESRLRFRDHQKRDLPYDPQKDFTPLGLVTSIPEALMVNKSVPAQSIIELIGLAKKQPGQLTHATGGSATLLSLELFKAMAARHPQHPLPGRRTRCDGRNRRRDQHDYRRSDHRQRRSELRLHTPVGRDRQRALQQISQAPDNG
jgi:hypothetical protein